ncbi:MAG: tyrosine recombinase XerC [Candidatus Neomarinimicrobiota bacterium]|nr:tyrosine recombinase XerC [Candidatus Neomarinimicrobiota bacterium]
MSEQPDRHVADFLCHLDKERSYSPHTVKAYQIDLVQFKQFLSDYGEGTFSSILTVDRKAVKHFIGYLSERGLSPRSTARKIASIKSFFRFLLKTDEIESNPAAGLQAPRRDRPLPKFIQKEIMKKVFVPSEEDDWQTRRDRTMLELLYSTGIRLSELVALDLKDVELDQLTVRVFGKGGKARVVLLGKTASEAIRAYRKERKIRLKEETRVSALFISNRGSRISPRTVQLRLKRLFESVTVGSGFTPHLMRHTFATHLLDGGADIQAVKELLGHTSLSSTQIYTHLKTEKMREIFNQAHPHA